MEKFVHEKNLKRYRDLLGSVTDEGQRFQINRLIAEEETKAFPLLEPPAE